MLIVSACPVHWATSTLVLLIYGYTWMTVGRLAGLAAQPLATMGQNDAYWGIGRDGSAASSSWGGPLLGMERA